MRKLKTIDIKAVIVDNDTGQFYQYFGMEAVTPKGVNTILHDINSKEPVTVNIASPGGDVDAASEIYTMLRQHEGEVHVIVQGTAASSASVIAMAGDQISMSPTAKMMIHRASTVISGNTNDAKHLANVLSTVDQSIMAAYQDRTGLPATDIIKMMEEETWLTAQTAVDKGFADEIMFVDDKQTQYVNSTLPLPSKAAVNKLLNLINQQNKQFKPSQPTLLQRKLTILEGE
ncbi:head maturation protease, ClpP-related [Lactiplantibacillus plantarum]|uniref:head maturation protease, ClpP-related n=1 Tax=Lactiplantibacillus plantarum TaxID=1590 RepID=UPI00309BB8F2